MLIEHIGKNINHQFVGNEFSVADEAVGDFTQLGSALDMVAEDISRRDVIQSIVLNKVLALSAFSGARCSKNYQIKHSVSSYLVCIYLYLSPKQDSH